MKKDTELGVIAVVGTLCLTAMVLLFPPRESEASEPYIRDIEYQEYHPYIHKTEESSQIVECSVQDIQEHVEDGFMGYTTEEIELIAQTVMNEVSIESFEIKQGIAEVIINRMESDYREFKYQTTIEEVVNAPNQWCTTNKYKPTKECYEATYAAIEYNAFPDDMLWARANRVDYGHEYTIKKDSITKFSTVKDYETERNK